MNGNWPTPLTGVLLIAALVRPVRADETFPPAEPVEIGQTPQFFVDDWIVSNQIMSLSGPSGGGSVITRVLRWLGGKLVINADADGGELKVRVSDPQRKVIEGFDYDDCVPVTTDDVAHEIRWKAANLDSLAGRDIRLEIYLRNAELFTFRSEK